MKDIKRLLIFSGVISIIFLLVFIEKQSVKENNFYSYQQSFQKKYVVGSIDEFLECNTTYTLSSITKGTSYLSEKFILRGVEVREGYMDFVFSFKENFIVKDFTVDIEFLGINNEILKHQQIIIDGVYSKYFTNFTCKIPENAINVKVNTIKFSNYNANEVLYADLEELHSLNEDSEIFLPELKIKRKNNVTVSIDYKKKKECSKAILMIHSNDGNILSSFILDSNKYKCDLNTDFGPVKYSICYLK